MSTYGEIFTTVYDRLFGGYGERAVPYLLRSYAAQGFTGPLPRVLDLGCGTGKAVLRFLEAGYPVTGLDLSKDMLEAARNRCLSFEPSGRIQWVEGDLAGFELKGPFGLVYSTYNSLNHLATKEEMRGCFRSVRGGLTSGSPFIFDYHTLKGLEEWTDREEGQFPEGKVEITRSFDAGTQRALMKVRGNWNGASFEEEIANRSFELEKLVQWLKEEGFSQVVLTDWTNMPKPIPKPDEETRLVIYAQ